METFDAEVLKIANEDIIKHLTRTPLPIAIYQIKNPGNIEDKTLRRLWYSAKRSMEHVEKYLKELVAEKNGQGTQQMQGERPNM